MFKYITLSIFCLNVLASCMKSDFLSEKPDQALIVPEKLSDFQALIDNDLILNGRGSGGGVNPAFGEAASDDYYVVDDDWYNTLPEGWKNLYTWKDHIYNENFYEWSYQYRAVLTANTVLDGIDKINISPGETNVYNSIKASALFFRSEMFYQLGEIFGPPFDNETADTDLSIVLRLTSDINESVRRSTVREVYDKVINDLMIAKDLLPEVTAVKTRPSRAAALAMLARVYLSMGNYDSALAYSNASLQISNNLLDYNDYLPVSETDFPFDQYNKEVVFHSCLNTTYNNLFFRGIARIDTNLLATYSPNDLRLQLFYRNELVGKSYKGSYDKSKALWGGIATDELYLIRAECYARKGLTLEAMTDLNNLLRTRWIKIGGMSTYIDQTAADSQDALAKILLERRKELIFRGLRWIDLRRLNKEGANITIKRKVNGQIVSLSPNSLQYTFLIPPDVISANPGMPQNPR